jgi:hypothetical protein
MNDIFDLLYSNYAITSQIMFPILVFIIILLVREFSKYSSMSDKIKNKIIDLANIIEDSGFTRKSGEKEFAFIERYLDKITSKD